MLGIDFLNRPKELRFDGQEFMDYQKGDLFKDLVKFLDVEWLAELTGGRSLYANERDYAPLFRALAEEVSSAYVLAFYPPEEKRRDGQLHTIRVEGPRGLTLRQSRSEYRAASK